MIDGHTRLYGIIGNPVKHSLSPLIHNTAFREMGMNAVYMAFETDDLEGAMKGVRALGIKGLSVTIPFKEKILALLDGLDPMAGQIGAINTVKRNGDALVGYNTDWIGAMAALERKTELGGRRCLLIGAGGAARAIAAGLKLKGAELMVSNRSMERAERLATEFGGKAITWKRRHEAEADIVINTTPLGMDPIHDPMPIEPSWAREGTVAMDIVIRVEGTRWLEEMAKRGCITVDGISMLVLQAIEQMKVWTGRAVPEDLVKSTIEGRLSGD